MKKLLSLLLMTNIAYADVIDFKITQQNFYCHPKQKCDVYTDFDVMIVNETNETHHYMLIYGLELKNTSAAYTSTAGIEIPPRGTFTHHYHDTWPNFMLRDSNAYLLKSGISIYGQPQTHKETLTTVWVY